MSKSSITIEQLLSDKSQLDCDLKMLNKRIQQLNKREQNLIKREQELAQREAAFHKSEKELAESRANIELREKNLERALKNSKAKNLFAVIYRSNYDYVPESIPIGTFENEKDAIDEVIEWLFRNKKGGFSAKWLNHLFYDRAQENPDEFEYDEDDFETDEQCIQYYQKKCNTWDELRECLFSDGDSFFEEERDGWLLQRIPV